MTEGEKASSESDRTGITVSIIIQTRATLLGRDLVWFDQNSIYLHTHVSKVKESSGETPSESHGSSNGDLEKSVDSNSPGRSWVWFPSTYDLKTHYVCINIAQISLIGSWVGFQAFPYISQVITP